MDADRILNAMPESLTREQLRESIKVGRSEIIRGAAHISGLNPNEGGVSTRQPWEDILTDEMGKASLFVSQEIFKRYNRLDLSSQFVSGHPLVRIFLKFKSWMAQDHRLKKSLWINVAKELKRGNPGPASRMIQSYAPMGLGGMAGIAAVLMITGREREYPFLSAESVDSSTDPSFDAFLPVLFLGNGERV